MGIDDVDYEALVRLTFFLGILITMVLWELALPRRGAVKRISRWPSNFGIVVLNSVFIMMLSVVPITTVSAAVFSTLNQFGLLNLTGLSLWPKMLISLLVLDLAIYWQHRLFHLMAPFWRVHRMHHTDTAIDVSTGLRFHPIEILLSFFIKLLVIVLIGAPILAVIAFEIILNGAAMFNHSNIRLNKNVDSVLRYFIVTPDMHRVHHSSRENEHHYNFGFCLSIWDRLFSSYKAQPVDGHIAMKIGLNEFDEPEESRIDRLLTQPFR